MGHALVRDAFFASITKKSSGRSKSSAIPSCTSKRRHTRGPVRNGDVFYWCGDESLLILERPERMREIEDNWSQEPGAVAGPAPPKPLPSRNPWAPGTLAQSRVNDVDLPTLKTPNPCQRLPKEEKMDQYCCEPTAPLPITRPCRPSMLGTFPAHPRHSKARIRSSGAEAYLRLLPSLQWSVSERSADGNRWGRENLALL